MKKSLWLLLFAGLVFSACKKGEDDPFFSFRTRDARIRGEWKLVEKMSIDEDGEEHTYDGTTYTIKENGIVTDSYAYQLNYTLEKGGTVKTLKVIDGVSYSGEDYWGWQNTSKKKTILMLFNNDYFIVTRLSNKELVLEQHYSQQEDGYSDSYTSKLTFEKQ